MLIQRGSVFTNYLNVQTCTVTLFNASLRNHTESKYHRLTRRDSRCDAVASSSPLPPNLLEQGQGAGSGNKVSAKKRLAVFVSGGGSNFKAIHEAIQNGSCNGEIVVVVTNAPACKAAEFAHDCNIPVLAYPPPSQNSSSAASSDHGVVRSLDEATLTEELQRKFSVDFVILAGYMKLVPCSLVRAYHRAMLNIHPGLLPSFGGQGFYGIRVHRAVIASGARFSGPTVHFVDEEYDRGPILAQAVVHVSPTDTPEMLAARVLKEEHKLYPLCVAALCDGRITWREDGIPILWNAS